jgi:carboxypeptidase Taq
MSSAVEELRERMAELVDLSNAAQLLEWDQQTMMPPTGGEARAEALATLQRISHEKFIAEETGSALDAAQAALDGINPDSDDAYIVRVTKRRWEKARRVPSDLAAEMAKAASLGQHAWARARADSDFPSFAPYLQHNIDLASAYVRCFEETDNPYDILLDDYEPGLSTADVARLFGELKAELLPLIAVLGEHRDQIDDSILRGNFDLDGQRRLVVDVLTLMGFDRASWRMDDAVHPFATSFGTRDVRITTRWDEAYFPSALYGAMHECGHGLYEAGIAPSLDRTPLGQIESLGLHESQSRLWENCVGRGRAFSGVLAPLIEKDLGVGMDARQLFCAVNRVQPTFIRVEADEATYGLHIILRFELEQELIGGRLAVADVPAAWNERFKETMGLDVPDDARGVLQDVHWSIGAIGYFPTYALGNLIAGQLWERAHLELPELEDSIAAGDLAPLREWLAEKVHRHGAKYGANELVRRIVGAPIEVKPFVSYLREKLEDAYELKL